MDECLHVEESHYQEGFEEGKVEGRVLGRDEGRLLGLDKGFELGYELGVYMGCVSMLKDALESQKMMAGLHVEVASKVARHVEALYGQLGLDSGGTMIQRIHDMMDATNDGDVSMHDYVDGIRSKFKLIVTLLMNGQPVDGRMMGLLLLQGTGIFEGGPHDDGGHQVVDARDVDRKAATKDVMMFDF